MPTKKKQPPKKSKPTPKPKKAGSQGPAPHLTPALVRALKALAGVQYMRARDLADKFTVSRSDASHKLNNLNLMGFARKDVVRGRPVFYITTAGARAAEES